MIQEVAKAEELPLSKNWWISVRLEHGKDDWEKFDFIKVTLESGDFVRPITSIMVPKMDSMVMESHSVVSRIIDMNIKATEAAYQALLEQAERMAEALNNFKLQVEAHGGDYLPGNAIQMFSALKQWQEFRR